jgi:hypothetical protein
MDKDFGSPQCRSENHVQAPENRRYTARPRANPTDLIAGQVRQNIDRVGLESG